MRPKKSKEALILQWGKYTAPLLILTGTLIYPIANEGDL